MKTWSSDVVLCTDGSGRLPDEQRFKLIRNNIVVNEKTISRVEGTLGKLERIVFEDATTIERSCIFFTTRNEQRSLLPCDLGCELTDKGAVRFLDGQRTSTPGVWIAGDAAHDSQYIILAAAHGVRAGMAINEELQGEDGLR